jgi:hypothetical protein
MNSSSGVDVNNHLAQTKPARVCYRRLVFPSVREITVPYSGSGDLADPRLTGIDPVPVALAVGVRAAEVRAKKNRHEQPVWAFHGGDFIAF